VIELTSSGIQRSLLSIPWHHNSQHNDTQQNDTQNNDTHHNDTQRNDTQGNNKTKIASNQSSLLLKTIFQSTQTLQLLTISIKTELFLQKLIKMENSKAWVESSLVLLIGGGRAQELN
jgi:hypothetical protein